MAQREVSLDIFRGLTLAAMILVNTPGSWSHIYGPLQHAPWHGLTPTDLIFPFFIFIVGAAMYHSMRNSVGQPNTWLRIIKRSALLFVIGVGLNAFPFNEPIAELRVMGVLQRIALAYLLGALIIITLPRKALWLVCGVILLGYWGLLNLVSAPYQLATNLVRQWDLALLGSNHLYQGFGLPFDPEGLISTLPAVVTLLMGYLTSALLAEANNPASKIKTLLLLALSAMAAGYIWSIWLPINKALWTSSYVLITSGWAWLILAAIVYLTDVGKLTWVFRWMQIYGTNPLLIYILAWLYADTLHLIPWSGQSAYQALYDGLNLFLSDKNASLAFAVLAVALFYGLSHWLYHKRLFIKL
ncbi:DUF1624 domain-containing protein [Neiella sp. HB171785]|uniref:DUF1624 domain-containing protein n=1 Tax=Neiella litorisoli TaxID=2771431 RepID=A0A8J6QGX8_9GAMM|nr:heparan-alpha-glucosaminide N-acetyltransferase domain-containing protein [Neiella litorisoli]MBD1388163.1 DUF1624 domain-containing protein [Neiella litorisoli]